MQTSNANKVKIAKRVIEVLDYFDHDHPTATVMDIVRRYDRPQSSTSELLSSLVELGLLYKDMNARSYMLTPRAAMLGSSTQPQFVRDGRLASLVERLAAQTHMSIGVFGMVGLEVQIFCWHNGQPPLKAISAKGVFGGMMERLCDSAAGWLLLSTVERRRREAILRRMNAESPQDQLFAVREFNETIERTGDRGYVNGRMGFGSIADVCAVLIPDDTHGRPMALGIAYEPDGRSDPQPLVEYLREAVTDSICPADRNTSQILQFSSAA